MSTGHNTFEIKSGGRPTGNPSQYNFSYIQTLLEATDPGKVTTAGGAFNSAAQAAKHVAHELYEVGTRLSSEWKGADADAAQKALGQLYATANELYWRSQQAGQALQTYANALPKYKGLNWPPDGASPVEDKARQQVAETIMGYANQDLGTAWDSMPDKVQQNLPDLTRHHVDEGRYNSGSPSIGNSGGGGLGGGGGSFAHVPKPHLPHGGQDITGGHHSQLAGMPPGGGGLGTLPPPTSTSPFGPGGGGSPFAPGGGNPFSPGGLGMTPPFTGPGGSSGGLPPGSSGLGTSPEGMRPSGLSAEESTAGAAAAEEAQAARTGMMGPQMGGAASGGAQSLERQRSTWLTEEGETWAAEESVPGLLGTPVAGRTSEENERERTTWLTEEREIWTGEETFAPETIGDAPTRFDEPDEAAPEAKDLEVLDAEQLQEMLDAIIAPDETNDESTSGGELAGLLEDLDIEDVNMIDRLLNE